MKVKSILEFRKLAIVISLFYCINLFGQNNILNTDLKNCGFQVSSEQLQVIEEHRAGLHYWEKQYHQRAGARNKQAIDIPVFFHISQSETTGSIATDVATIEQALVKVNEDFAETEFKFVLVGVDTIIDNNFFLKGDSQLSGGIINRFKRPNLLNIFVVDNIEMEALAYARFGGYVVMQAENLIEYWIKTTLSHEIGHFLGLYHTHGKYNTEVDDCVQFIENTASPLNIPLEVFCGGAARYDDVTLDENADGIADCAQTGDDVCDTPADPRLSTRVDNSCVYSSTIKDFYGDFYNPSTDNIMSYARNSATKKDCRSSFTEGQNARMYAFLMEFNQDLLCPQSTAPTSGILMVNTTENDCVGSLRWAVETTNTSEGKHTILFDEVLFGTPQTIYLKKTLEVGSDVEIIGNGNIILDGSQADSTLSNSGNIVVNVRLSNVDNVQIQGVTIQNMGRTGLSISNSTNVQLNQITSFKNALDGIDIFNSEKIKLSNLVLEGNVDDGLFIYNGKEITATQMSISNQGRSGIWIEQNSSQLTFEDVEISENGLDGITILDSEQITLEEIDMSNNDIGLYVEAGKEIGITRLKVLNHTNNGIFINNNSSQIVGKQLEIGQNGFHGISISDSENIIVDSSRFFQNERRGLAVFDAKEVQITNGQSFDNESNGMGVFNSSNIFLTKNHIAQNRLSGLSLFNVNQIQIDNNQIESNLSHGVFLRGTSKAIQLNNLEVFNNDSTGFKAENVEELSIKDSRFNTNNYNGISFENSTKVVVQETEILENRNLGVEIVQLEALEIAGCQIKNNGNNGLFIKDNSEDIVIHKTTVQENGFHGLALVDALNVQIDSSHFTNNPKSGLFILRTEALHLNNSQSQSNVENGIICFYVSELSMEGIIVAKNEYGVVSFANSQIQMDKGTRIYENLKDGIQLGRTTETILNRVEVFKNGEYGVFRFDSDIEGADNTTAPFLQIDSSNFFENGIVGVEDASNLPFTLKNSTVHCNGAMDLELANSIAKPTDLGAINREISGRSVANSEVFIYVNNNDCTACGAQQLIGRTMTDDQGNWVLSNASLERNKTYEISAIAVLDATTSLISDCYSYTVPEIIDMDMDGVEAALDCNDNDASINPNATDIPNNGIDEDCDGMDAQTSSACGIPVVTLDTVSHVWFIVRWLTNESTDSNYVVRLREQGAVNWETNEDWSANSIIWANRKPCTQYEIQVAATCGGEVGSFSPSTVIQTAGCDDVYCPAYGVAFDNWIGAIRINGQRNISNRNYGYGDYTDFRFDTLLSRSFELELIPGTRQTEKTNLIWSVWIDYNRNQLFDSPDERFVFGVGDNQQSIVRQIQLPADVSSGEVRLRVILDAEEGQNPCTGTALQFREVEDYTLSIGELTTSIKGLISPSQFQVLVAPNPFNNQFIFKILSKDTAPITAQLFDRTGRIIQQFTGKNAENIVFNGADLSSGLYLLKVYQNGSFITKKIIKR